ncbi:MAG: tRNA pseudouridine(38-40) synthase TruA [Kiritimatiellaeota bacterium]|nr:tRNA pseudouridine(38-40) synthase TruA [Kiritimatiellota bacterium]
MPRYALTISYDGTRFHGWQRQVNGSNVQELLAGAILPLCKDGPVSLYASGRTDAGVHAHGQVVHFDMERVLTPEKLRRAINDALPPDIQVLDARAVADDFHARKSVRVKEYRYTIYNAETMPPCHRLYAAHVRTPINLDALRAAAERFVGRHDFAAFSANPRRELASTVRTVFSLDVASRPADLQPAIFPSSIFPPSDLQPPDLPPPDIPPPATIITLAVRGEGFLYKMVRSIAGFLIAVGTGREPPEAVTEILATRIRTARVESAPPQGLTLWRVEY